MSKKLKNLDVYNETVWLSKVRNLNKMTPSGLECPKCKKELMDSNVLELPLSWPMRMAVVCKNHEHCDYEGFRFVEL